MRRRSPGRSVHAGVDEYRAMMSFFPTGVSVLTTVGSDGNPRGLTCSSLTSVTLEPPTLLVCVRNGSGTLEALRDYGRFGVNLLHSRGRAAAEVFSRPGDDRFGRVAWRATGPGGLPCLVQDAFAFAECWVTGTMVVGDHTMVLGEVARVSHDTDVPLLYGLRQFSAWLSAKT